MKTIILALRLSVLFCFLFTLTACGGGGGGGGGSKDSPPATVTPSDSDGDGVDDPQDKFPKDPSESVDTDADGIGNNADTDDDNDNYSDNLDAFPLDKNRWNRLAVSLNSLDLSVTFGSSYSLAGERLAIAGDNAPWRAHSSQSWLTLSQSSGMGPANIGISCNGSELTPGIHTANVTFVDTDTQDQQVVTISVNVALPALQISNFGGDNGVIFNVSNGWEFFSGERIWINLDTGEAQYPTSISLNFPLANAITTDLSQTSLSNSGQFLQLGVDRSHVRAGKYEGSLTITANVKGRLVSRTLPVSLTASEHILYTSDDGIAFTSLPSLHKLSQVITIKDSYELTDTRWTATTSQPWLTATPSGTTATDLIIHADPAGLAQNKLHIATVDIAPDDPNIENNMQIQVGLWVGNTEPNEIHRLSANYVQVAADPVRPYVYAHDGNSTIRIFNIFNYSQVGTITNVGSELGEMKVSGDGTYLVVYDTHAENLVRINLNTPASRLKIPLPVYSTAFAMARPLGHSVLLLGNGEINDLVTGIQLTPDVPPFSYSFSAIAASTDGRRYCTIDRGTSLSKVECHSLVYASVNSFPIYATPLSRFPLNVGGNGKDVAINSGGTRVFAADAAVRVFTEGTLPEMEFLRNLDAGDYPNNIEAAEDGTILGSAGWDDFLDFRIYNADGSLRRSAKLSGVNKTILDRQLVVSGDSSMAVVLTDDPAIVFVRAD